MIDTALIEQLRLLTSIVLHREVRQDEELKEVNKELRKKLDLEIKLASSPVPL